MCDCVLKDRPDLSLHRAMLEEVLGAHVHLEVAADIVDPAGLGEAVGPRPVAEAFKAPRLSRDAEGLGANVHLEVAADVLIRP